jgi:mannose-6-phosphate isomerase
MSATDSIFKITPLPQQRLWGTPRLSAQFEPKPQGDPYGEIFLCSAMTEADCQIDGMTMTQFYQKHQQTYFGIKNTLFPLRVNLIDTASALSIQVHPDERFTSALGYPHGVHEFWLILNSEKDSSIELGHKAPDQSTLKTAIDHGTFSAFLINKPVKRNEFFYLPPGTLHAIGKGLTVYELTANLDITYRVYDYDRIQASTGKKRQLHIQQALEVITFPQSAQSGFIPDQAQAQITILFDQSEVFTLIEWNTNGSTQLPIDSFYVVTVIEGQGTIESIPVNPYDTFLIPKNRSVLHIEGTMRMLAATVHEKG